MGFFKRFRKPKVIVTLDIPQESFTLGSKINGTITLSSKEEFDATEVRAELRCIEKRRRERWVYNQRLKRNIRQVYWDSATLLSEDLEASGPIHFVPGFKKTFPIRVNIPISGRQTLDSLDSTVSWMIKGVVAVDDRPDSTSETLELQIAGITTKSKKEEVEMVSCKYCRGLMPSNTSSCPICGAPRKK